MRPNFTLNGISAYVLAGIFLTMLVLQAPADREFLLDLRGEQPGFARFIEGTPWESEQIEFGYGDKQRRCVYSGALHQELGDAIGAGQNILIRCDRTAYPPKVYEVVVDDTSIVDYQQTMREFRVERIIGSAAFIIFITSGTYITFFRRSKLNRKRPAENDRT